MQSVEQVRRFNRTVTRRIGVLNDEYLATGRPLGASRLLWEIGPDGAERRLTASRVELRTVDPDHADAKGCIRAYFAELAERSHGRFDPRTSLPADRHELIPLNGAFLVAYLDGAPVGCGAVKHPPGSTA